MSFWEALILGIVQGLTEFLPVSSSGHLALANALLGGAGPAEENLLLSVVLHAATALATVVVFRKDIFSLLKGLLKNPEDQRFALLILLSMIPVGVVGIFFKDKLETLFGDNVLFVGCMLLLTGFLLLLTHYRRQEFGREVGFLDALVIGLAQAVAVLPGISRSGSTIATALLLGVDRNKAARFSFLMVLPPIAGATLLELKDFMEAQAAGEAIGLSFGALGVGFVAAFVSGLVACQWMIRLVQRGQLFYFAVYCFIVGLLAIATAYLA